MTTGYGTPGMELGDGRVPAAPGSHPSGHAASGVDGASRVNPSRVADLELALGVALDYLIQFEPGDSRGVSNEFVAMAAIYCGHTHRLDECRQILHASRVRSGPAIAMEARQGGDGEAGSVHDSAVPQAIAQTSEVNND